MKTIIYNKEYDKYITDRIFAVGKYDRSIIEIQRMLFNGTIDYKVKFHGQYNDKIENCPDFKFDSILSFFKFVGILMMFLSNNKAGIHFFGDNQNKNKLYIVTGVAGGNIVIYKERNYKNIFRKNKHRKVWGIMLTKDEVNQIVNAVKGWFE